MKNFIAKRLKKFPARFGLRPVEENDRVNSYTIMGRALSYARLDSEMQKFLTHSKSQHGQDWLVEKLTGQKPNEGYFVEFGAVNGIQNSNTYYMEKILGWKGIVGEPARKWHEALRKNRGCSIETRCVYKNTGDQLEFVETGSWMGGNTLSAHKNDDGAYREISDRYIVDTISLNDLLKTHNAPKYIDFMSVDTEGSEFEILNAFDFSQASFGVILVEHNRVETKRQAIRSLLEENGYKHMQIPEEISVVDDWYASANIYKAFEALVAKQSA
ncbi:FkbM family methyltransferase [Roseovarius sp. MMSF_3359]|uniref:FkbM family methyltransferase n=1 Tax=Roseovarius sp. MMSF_3359 TaxID=3046707 RepID=UPI00273EB728|nr:FkbM family methyltransferase [Roseovarius sp. MMSF_3359]